MQPLAPHGESRAETLTGQERASSGVPLFEKIVPAGRFRLPLMGKRGARARRLRGIASVVGAFAVVAGGGYIASASSGNMFSVASVTQFAGFKASNLVVNGNQAVDVKQIKLALAQQGSATFFDFDVDAARKQLLENPWLAQAEVRKMYPDTLVVEVKERIPFAFWKLDNRVQVIARDGTVLGEAQPKHLLLPQVVGSGANNFAPQFVAAVAGLPAIAERSRAFVRVAERRWNLVLEDGVTVMLPENGWRAALAELNEIHGKNQLLDRNLVQVDLRIADRLVVRLQPEDAQQRREQFEELSKKGRRKI